jgi:hypothetical protein
MNNPAEFHDLWKKQESAVIPGPEEVFRRAETLRKKTRNGLIRANLLGAGIIAFIVWVVLNAHPRLITTKIGVLLVIIAVICYLLAYNRIIPLLGVNPMDSSNTHYLRQLIEIKKKQEFLHKTMLSFYFALLSLGIFLYMIEYAGRMSLAGALLAYGITTAWIALNWFYFRPRIIKKKGDEIGQLIENLKKVSRDLNEPD